MDDLIRQIVREKLQLEEHSKHGELHQYIDDNAADLVKLFDRCIQLMIKGAGKDAA